MFPITRLAISATNLERNAVKSYAKFAKLTGYDSNTAFCTVKNTLQDSNIKPYSKNIFKRAAIWVKKFVKTYKQIKTAVKGYVDGLQSQSETALSKSQIKEAKNSVFTKINTSISAAKEKLNDNLEKLIAQFPIKPKRKPQNIKKAHRKTNK